MNVKSSIGKSTKNDGIEWVTGQGKKGRYILQGNPSTRRRDAKKEQHSSASSFSSTSHMPSAFGRVQRTRRSCRDNSQYGCLLVANIPLVPYFFFEQSSFDVSKSCLVRPVPRCPSSHQFNPTSQVCASAPPPPPSLVPSMNLNEWRSCRRARLRSQG